MKTWDNFYPFVAPEVSGCPYPVIDHHLRQAARDFCERSKAWREWVDAFTADGTTNLFDYDLLTNQQELVKVARAIRNEEDKLDVRAGGALPEDWESGDSVDDFVTDTLVHFDNAQFMVFPLPTDGDTFRLEMVLKPSMASTGVGDVIYTSYANEVASGAKKTLLAMPRRDWTDLTQAARFSMEFETGIHRAANKDFARTERSQRNRMR